MRRLFLICLTGCLAAMGGLILFAVADASGIAKNVRPAAVVTSLSKKGDRLPIEVKARVSSPGAIWSAGKRPPLGCDPMFSTVADPARAGLYRRCAA